MDGHPYLLGTPSPRVFAAQQTPAIGISLQDAGAANGGGEAVGTKFYRGELISRQRTARGEPPFIGAALVAVFRQTINWIGYTMRTTVVWHRGGWSRWELLRITVAVR